MKQRARRGSRSCARSRSPFTKRRAIAEPGYDAGLRSDGWRRRFACDVRRIARPNLPTFARMHQECRPAIDAGPHQIDTALGVFPIPGHNIFQLLVQEFFGRLFVSRIHFHETASTPRGRKSGASPF